MICEGSTQQEIRPSASGNSPSLLSHPRNALQCPDRGSPLLIKGSALLELLVEFPPGGIFQYQVDPLLVIEVVVELKNVGMSGRWKGKRSCRLYLGARTDCRDQSGSIRRGRWGVGVGLGCEVIRFDEEPGSGVTAYFRCAWISISRRSWCSTPSFSI